MRRLALVGVVVAVVGCSSSSSDPAPTALATTGSSTASGTAASATAASDAPRPPADPIERGKPIERAIKATERHRYRIQLSAGQVARGVVMQKGMDVALIVYDPAGKKLVELDSPNGEVGPEPFAIEATSAGAYDLEIKPYAEPGPGGAVKGEGRYEAKLDDIITADEYADIHAKERISSPRILEIDRAVRKHDAAAVDKFWADLKGKSPIVEPYPGDPQTVLMTFVLRTKAPYVALFGAVDFREKPMVRIGDSDLHYLTARVPIDSRLDYAFMATDGPGEFHAPFRPDRTPDPRWGKKQTDPNNPMTHFDFSRVELPGAPPQPYITPKPDVAKGTITEIKLDSAAMKESRRVGVYTPPDYDPKKTYPLVVAFDGELYGLEPLTMLPLTTILDNMIAEKKIPPVVAALVANQGVRDRDLTGSPAFSAFLATELVPELRAKYRAGTTAADTIVTGSSFGGLCSMYTGFQNPEVFGNVLSQSGSFQFKKGSIGVDVSDLVEGGWLIRDVAAAPKKPLRVYLDAGRFEQDLTASNRQMRDVLIAKGYPLTYQEFSGGHDYWWWRGTISDGLIALLKK